MRYINSLFLLIHFYIYKKIISIFFNQNIDLLKNRHLKHIRIHEYNLTKFIYNNYKLIKLDCIFILLTTS
jgi:hypothetical protein